MAESTDAWARRVAKKLAYEALYCVEIEGKPLMDWIHEVMKRDKDGAPLAEWKDVDDSYWFVCSRCDYRENYKSSYCPNCGARMMP